MENDKTALILTTARRIISAEQQALERLGSLLDENLVHAIKVIMEMPPNGRVVVMGMGKAGFIGMKISATLASTGVPSFFLHPAEAIHGDLGRFSKNDTALVLSHSGETEEILRVLPHVRSIGCPVIAITSSRESQLAEHSDVVLLTGVKEEAGKHGLAPTTSALAMLALGDALAMSILEEQQFTPEQFALYHPGGTLGRKLMLAEEIMRRGEKLCLVQEETLLRDVIHQISQTPGRPGAAAVVNEQGKLCGIFTDGNLRRCLEAGSHTLDEPVEKFMGKNPKSVSPKALAQDALRCLREHKIDQVLVVADNYEVLGMIDIQDLIDLRMV